MITSYEFSACDDDTYGHPRVYYMGVCVLGYLVKYRTTPFCTSPSTQVHREVQNGVARSVLGQVRAYFGKYTHQVVQLTYWLQHTHDTHTVAALFNRVYIGLYCTRTRTYIGKFTTNTGADYFGLCFFILISILHRLFNMIFVLRVANSQS